MPRYQIAFYSTIEQWVEVEAEDEETAVDTAWLQVANLPFVPGFSGGDEWEPSLDHNGNEIIRKIED